VSVQNPATQTSKSEYYPLCVIDKWLHIYCDSYVCSLLWYNDRRIVLVISILMLSSQFKPCDWRSRVILMDVFMLVNYTRLQLLLTVTILVLVEIPGGLPHT
jgi:hypothetical protein